MLNKINLEEVKGYMYVVIREANIEDRKEIFELVEVFATSFKVEQDSFNESIKQLIDDDSALLLVAEIEKRVVGYCLGFDHFAFYSNGRVSWLEEIMVNESYRRKDVGKMLMKKFEEWSKLKNSKLISLATRRAASFYSAIGYEESAVYFRKLI
jgi:GNAT superfamily N-acetyltransferase